MFRRRRDDPLGLMPQVELIAYVSALEKEVAAIELDLKHLPAGSRQHRKFAAMLDEKRGRLAIARELLERQVGA